MEQENNPSAKAETLLQNIKAASDTMNRRMTRIESRLTQLMVWQGMQTDGRKPIINRGERHVG